MVATNDVTKAVSNLLIRMGIPASISGFRYLKTAINMAIEDGGVIKGKMTAMYNIIAETYETTDSRVERCMRSAIAHTKFLPLTREVLPLYGQVNYKNSEFIYMVAEYVMMHCSALEEGA